MVCKASRNFVGAPFWAKFDITDFHTLKLWMNLNRTNILFIDSIMMFKCICWELDSLLWFFYHYAFLVSLEDRYIIICSKSVLLYKSDMFLLLPATHNLLTRNWQRNTSLQSYFTQYLFFHDNIDMITSGQNEIICLRFIIPVAGLNFEVQFEYEGRNELDKLTYEVMVLVWVWLW